MFALVDGNNFYVSCEKVFNPSLEGKPVVVLSNNDGCIISRSNEAKALGFKMAEPIFKRRDLVEKNNVKVYSSNYTLYGDLSNRMMKILSTFSPEIEVYSIDEGFINLQGFTCDLREYAQKIKSTIYQHIGIPVGVGVAATKTLAKVANKISKKQKGIFVIDDEKIRDWAIRNTEIADVWGIGRQYAKLLASKGIKTAYDFTLLDSSWIKKNMSVTGQRIKEELLGRSCINLEMVSQPKKNIATTRSFGRKISDINIISEALATHAVRCAEKLREQKSVAQYLTVFIHTDPFSESEKYIYKATTITLPVATSSNNEMAKAAMFGLKQIYEKGLMYKKAGAIVGGISDEGFVQGNLFEAKNNIKLKQVSQIADKMNMRYGRDTVKLAIQGLGGKPDWKLKQENLSQRYTTRWDELLKIKV